MSKQKGFTLIEIIGVVVILSLLLILTVPSLTKTLKRNEQNKYNDYIDNLKIAAENYVVNKLKEGVVINDYMYITLGDLIDAGYVQNIITDPTNNKDLSRRTQIAVLKEADGTFKYEVSERYTFSSEYQEVEYIESTGEQYINTGVNVSEDLNFELVAECTSVADRDGAYFGARDSININGQIVDGVNANGMVLWLNTMGQDESKQIIVFRYGVGPDQISPFILNKGEKVYFRSNTSGNNVTYVSNDYKMSYEKQRVTYTGEIVLMGVGMRDGRVDERTFIGKTYYFKIYKNKKLIRHFIPCYRKSDGVIGLYDLVNDVFYTNSGTGEFEKGADV